MMLDTLIEFIRESSKQGKLIVKNELEEGPLFIKASQIEKLIKELKEKTEDIDIIKGKKEEYLYSKNYISNSYRDILFNLKEKNIEEVVVNIVREESKIYPRPTSLEVFKLAPFNIVDLEVLVKEILKNEKHMDIKIVKASNEARYFYSDLYMSLGHAKGLCEWVEVGQFENP